MIRRPPRSTRTDTLFPYTTLFRSRRLLAGQDRQFALQEITERQPGGVDIAALAIDDVHRHIEHIVGVAFIAEALFENEREHHQWRRIGVRPESEAVRERSEARRVGKECVSQCEYRGGRHNKKKK